MVWPYCHQWQDRGETSGDVFPPAQGAQPANAGTQSKSKNLLPDCSTRTPPAYPISCFTITCFTKKSVTGQNSPDFSAGSAVYWCQLVKRSHITTPQCTLRFPPMGRGCLLRPVEDPTVETMLTLHISLVPAVKLVCQYSHGSELSDSSQSTLVPSSQMLYRTWPFWLPGLSKGSSLSQIPFYFSSIFILAAGLTEIIFQERCSVIPLTAQSHRPPANHLSQKAATFPRSGCISASIPPAGAEQGLTSYSTPSEAISWKQKGQWI